MKTYIETRGLCPMDKNGMRLHRMTWKNDGKGVPFRSCEKCGMLPVTLPARKIKNEEEK